MSKSLVEITGFNELEKKLKNLTNDKVKSREVRKILGQVANPTVKAAKQLTPSASDIKVNGKSYSRKKRQVRKTVVEENYTAGMGKKSIGKKMLTKAKNPMLVVRARDISIGGKKKYGGFYLRQFILRGTKNIKSNPFMDKAYNQTKGLVTAAAESKITKYIQKAIDRL
ncbi:hypothetical protein OD91_0856 [Lutibacter sp. Hel_I_33_5]|uniref:hypothetical protein n=1 Tax=Lutibacter sp. Hel_I_33_5 TaxID=1566289 RepID=UPI0011A7E4BF|nr:hypothetical protein [Lutibacter sp. Hel_I_33_5]TVZ55601.1 hypothetical protein OD91_0856 [Lutibacter sp. Hel_I_33_5]